MAVFLHGEHEAHPCLSILPEIRTVRGAVEEATSDLLVSYGLQNLARSTIILPNLAQYSFDEQHQ